MNTTSPEAKGKGAPFAVRPASPPADLMETASCMVRIGGDVQNEVPLYGVTAPEIILLRTIHRGNDAVYKVERDGAVAAGSVNERIRLLQKYPQYARMVGELFPGVAPQFPRTIAEVEAMVQNEQDRAEAELTNPSSAITHQPINNPLD